MAFIEDDGELFSWGDELDGRQARLDAAFEAYERRHHGSDGGRHHRPYVEPEKITRGAAALAWLMNHPPVHEWDDPDDPW